MKREDKFIKLKELQVDRSKDMIWGDFLFCYAGLLNDCTDLNSKIKLDRYINSIDIITALETKVRYCSHAYDERGLERFLGEEFEKAYSLVLKDITCSGENRTISIIVTKDSLDAAMDSASEIE